MITLMFIVIGIVFLAPFWFAFGILSGIIGIIGAATGEYVRPEVSFTTVYSKKDLKAAEREAFIRGYLEGYDDGFDEIGCR